MENINKTSQKTLSDLFATFDPVKIGSHPGIRKDLFRRPVDQTLITDFFGGVAHAEVVDVEDDGVEEAITPIPEPVPVSQPAEKKTVKASTEGVKFDTTSKVDSPTLRAWGSLVIIGLLTAFVASSEMVKKSSPSAKPVPSQ
jgi:GPI-anchor transamidase subunit K